jgi:hypothetical protein
MFLQVMHEDPVMVGELSVVRQDELGPLFGRHPFELVELDMVGERELGRLLDGRHRVRTPSVEMP